MRFIPLIALFFIFSCKQKPNLAQARVEILNLLQQERKAHFDRDVNLFMSEFADSMIMVNKGIVSVPTKEQHKERIGKYFGSVKFVKWDDSSPPIIRFSDDASLAYAVVQKQVVLTYPDSFGNSFTDTTNYSWVAIYRKQKGKWMVECNASTNK